MIIIITLITSIIILLTILIVMIIIIRKTSNSLLVWINSVSPSNSYNNLKSPISPLISIYPLWESLKERKINNKKIIKFVILNNSSS